MLAGFTFAAKASYQASVGSPSLSAHPAKCRTRSIDAELQRAMVAAFGQYEGSAIAMDPRTGEILGMVSLPSFDANLFVNGISHADYKALNDNPSRPQFNRLVLGGIELRPQAVEGSYAV